MYLLAFYACLGLGTLAKGPVAPLLAAAIIVLHAVAVRDLRIIARTLWFPGVLLFCLLACNRQGEILQNFLCFCVFIRKSFGIHVSTAQINP